MSNDTTCAIGMVGLGRMGGNMARRLARGGVRVVGHDADAGARAALADEPGVAVHDTLADLVARLRAHAGPCTVWSMLPAGTITDDTLARLHDLLTPGDLIVEGGNANYLDSQRRAAEARARGLGYVDCGVSGGVWGLERGYCLSLGGAADDVARLEPFARVLAPTADAGWLHCGPSGAGHFVKMVHNGIEYGLMAAYAEGLNILRHAGVGDADHAKDAETSPLEHPELYGYRLDLPAITELWRRGSVVSSWLLDLTAAGFAADGADLSGYSGRVSDSGEGRWTVHAAIDEGVPAHVLSAALYSRFASRGEADFGDRVLSMMRKQFGGHAEVHPEAAS